jgi:hypothetical protein
MTVVLAICLLLDLVICAKNIHQRRWPLAAFSAGAFLVVLAALVARAIAG